VSLRADGLYCTSNLNFAAYLEASKRLKFVKVEPRTKHHSDFYFDDPHGEGPAIESENRRNDLKIGARSLFDSRATLIAEVMRSGGVR
jgi:hypothetical protein